MDILTCESCLLLIFTIISPCYAIECLKPSSACVCETDEGLVDLHPLDDPSGNRAYFSYVSANDTYQYSYNPCTPFNCVMVGPLAVCQDADSNAFFTIAYHDSYMWNTTNDRLVITLKGDDRYAIITLVCNHTEEGTLLAYGQPTVSSNDYYFTLVSRHACPQRNGTTESAVTTSEVTSKSVTSQTSSSVSTSGHETSISSTTNSETPTSENETTPTTDSERISVTSEGPTNSTSPGLSPQTSQASAYDSSSTSEALSTSEWTSKRPSSTESPGTASNTLLIIVNVFVPITASLLAILIVFAVIYGIFFHQGRDVVFRVTSKPTPGAKELINYSEYERIEGSNFH